MKNSITPQGGISRRPAPLANYYKCECTFGVMVDRETYFRMVHREDLVCPQCNYGWMGFTAVGPEDEPNDDNYDEKVERYEDLLVHAQGEDEGASDENQ